MCVEDQTSEKLQISPQGHHGGPWSHDVNSLRETISIHELCTQPNCPSRTVFWTMLLALQSLIPILWLWGKSWEPHNIPQ